MIFLSITSLNQNIDIYETAHYEKKETRTDFYVKCFDRNVKRIYGTKVSQSVINSFI